MVHLNVDPRTYELLKSVAKDEDRTLRTVAARAIRSYAGGREAGESATSHEEVTDGAA